MPLLCAPRACRSLSFLVHLTKQPGEKTPSIDLGQAQQPRSGYRYCFSPKFYAWLCMGNSIRQSDIFVRSKDSNLFSPFLEANKSKSSPEFHNSAPGPGACLYFRIYENARPLLGAPEICGVSHALQCMASPQT